MSKDSEVTRALFHQAMQYAGELPLYFPNREGNNGKPPEEPHIEVRQFRGGSTAKSFDGSEDDHTVGFLQMLVRVHKNTGDGLINKVGDDIVALFPRYAILDSEGALSIKVQVSKRPVLGTAIPTDAWYEMPISIYYEVSL